MSTRAELGLRGKAQIGKGMWAMPDLMQAMIDTKLGHPKAGANCAGYLHQRQRRFTQRTTTTRPLARFKLSLKERSAVASTTYLRFHWAIAVNCQPKKSSELDNNVQGMLGYVVRWVDQGVGCSKVPDINNVGLMEDRATLRISSQHIANWLHHGVITEDQFKESMLRMEWSMARTRQIRVTSRWWLMVSHGAMRLMQLAGSLTTGLWSLAVIPNPLIAVALGAKEINLLLVLVHAVALGRPELTKIVTVD